MYGCFTFYFSHTEHLLLSESMKVEHVCMNNIDYKFYNFDSNGNVPSVFAVVTIGHCSGADELANWGRWGRLTGGNKGKPPSVGIAKQEAAVPRTRGRVSNWPSDCFNECLFSRARFA